MFRALTVLGSRVVCRTSGLSVTSRCALLSQAIAWDFDVKFHSCCCLESWTTGAAGRAISDGLPIDELISVSMPLIALCRNTTQGNTCLLPGVFSLPWLCVAPNMHSPPDTPKCAFFMEIIPNKASHLRKMSRKPEIKPPLSPQVQ